LRDRLPIIFLATIQTKTFFIIYHVITQFHDSFSKLSNNYNAWNAYYDYMWIFFLHLYVHCWRLDGNFMQTWLGIYMHVLKTSWKEWYKQWNVSTNNLYKFFKVDNSHPMLELQDWDSQLKSRNQVNTFDTCTKCN